VIVRTGHLSQVKHLKDYGNPSTLNFNSANRQHFLSLRNFVMSSSQCNTQQPASVEYDNLEQPVDYEDRTKAHEGHDYFLYEAEYQPTVNAFRITPNSNRGVHQGHHKSESSGEDNSQEGNRTWNSVGLGLGGESKINRRQRLSITDRILVSYRIYFSLCTVQSLKLTDFVEKKRPKPSCSARIPPKEREIYQGSTGQTGGTGTALRDSESKQ
jgi:hypothetical protein